MYCRKCGVRLGGQVKFCNNCGTEVIQVKQPTEQERKEMSIKNPQNVRKVKENPNAKNNYIVPSLLLGVLSFLLMIFPWPRSWNIGTSLWMKILIVVISILAVVNVNKARQVNNILYRDHRIRVNPEIVKLASFIAYATTLIGTFALFMSF